MAASQARFLGLTARKSNVEYQGQQINQQRTALATESSNLYNQMLSLEVPTPPVTTDYYNTVYTLDDSSTSTTSDYTIVSVSKSYNSSNTYSVRLKTTTTEPSGVANTMPFTKVAVTYSLDDSGESYEVYTITINGTAVTYDSEDDIIYSTDSDGETVLNTIVANKIYKIDSTTDALLAASDDTYSSVKEEMISDGAISSSQDFDSEEIYFYQDSSGKTYYLTKDQLERMTQISKDTSYVTNESTSSDGTTTYTIADSTYISLYYSYDRTTESYITVQATLEESSTGRYSSITIEGNSAYPTNLSGATYSITTTSEYDEDAYNDAYNDYEYLKSVYEKEMSDINAQTEVIQSEDKQLELRLQQLDTEQEAIAQEMESVKTVIDDNIEKTFDAFA